MNYMKQSADFSPRNVNFSGKYLNFNSKPFVSCCETPSLMMWVGVIVSAHGLPNITLLTLVATL